MSLGDKIINSIQQITVFGFYFRSTLIWGHYVRKQYGCQLVASGCQIGQPNRTNLRAPKCTETDLKPSQNEPKADLKVPDLCPSVSLVHI